MPGILLKRGRPKASMLQHLILEGEQVKSDIKCEYCKRNFPRRKSLITHWLLHTNEKPFNCMYPGCEKSFRQSGQLRNHLRTHTGEKPFTCPETGCLQRYIHSSRKCPKHKKYCVKDGNEEVVITEYHSQEEVMWLEEFKGKLEEEKLKRKTENKKNKDLVPLNPPKPNETKKNKAKRVKYDDASSSSSSSVTSDDFQTDYSPEMMNSSWGYSAVRLNERNEEDLEYANMLLSFQAIGRSN